MAARKANRLPSEREDETSPGLFGSTLVFRGGLAGSSGRSERGPGSVLIAAESSKV